MLSLELLRRQDPEVKRDSIWIRQSLKACLSGADKSGPENAIWMQYLREFSGNTSELGAQAIAYFGTNPYGGRPWANLERQTAFAYVAPAVDVINDLGPHWQDPMNVLNFGAPDPVLSVWRRDPKHMAKLVFCMAVMLCDNHLAIRGGGPANDARRRFWRIMMQLPIDCQLEIASRVPWPGAGYKACEMRMDATAWHVAVRFACNI